MKHFIHSLLLVAIASSLMIACKKESLSHNQTDLAPSPALASDQRGSGGILVGQQNLKLTRRGSDTIIYNRDGRLGKVMKDAANYTVYTYGINSITAKTYISNSLFKEVFYKLDATTGRALEATSKHYLYLGNDLNTSISAEVFEYDASGRLATKYNMSNPQERYTYFQSQDAYSINIDGSDGKTKRINHYPTKNKMSNTFKLNPENSGLDIYLNIFGTVCKYIPSGKHIWDVATNGWIVAESHIYTLNKDGYPTQLQRKDLLNNISTTETFAYLTVK
jgi:hypothetical protein